MSTATELLRRALNSLNNLEDQLKDLGYGWLGGPQLREEIETFLAAEPETEEPVAWIQPNHLDKAQFMPFLCRVEPKQRDDFIPLYTRPEPARKPMTHEEIIQGVTVDTSDDFHAGYWAGIRFAEKHHGFSSSIPSLNDTISEDSEEIKPIWLKPNEMIGWRGYFDVRGFDRMYGDVFDSEEECMARTPTATGYQQIVIELPEEELIDEELENKDE